MLQLDFNGGILVFTALEDTNKHKIQEIIFSDQQLVNSHQIHTVTSKMQLPLMERQWTSIIMVLRMEWNL